jgi:mannitol-specific phosphotransferase system IIBC component
MNPVWKFYLARLALVAAVAVPLMFFINALLALAAGILVSMVLGYVLLKKQREAMINHIDDAVKRRRQEKQQLRAELAGDSDA